MLGTETAGASNEWMNDFLCWEMHEWMNEWMNQKNGENERTDQWLEWLDGCLPD